MNEKIVTEILFQDENVRLIRTYYELGTGEEKDYIDYSYSLYETKFNDPVVIWHVIGTRKL